ncbi:hypothetical protein MGG_14109 [Pyricularia oryzae 70-15]|uniref:Uncharacterized protein n=1 Tax=Pyricularia oryzae (strain 70-15 / ATCC MYA-4617 / FGSC 8958) TaxID=242507 RepID=G4MXE5_PYRO7|nr:uncharacterized protein MGG_14109 [Pyricularia oryzae 70-15]EHA53475.1 hypothetical protein MGG_14109 [Pyricularia oryzae 70-15]
MPRGLGHTVSFLLETRGIRLADQHLQRRVATQLVKTEAILDMARDRAGEVYKTVEDAWAVFILGLEVERLGYVFSQTVEVLNATSSSLARILYEGHVLNTVTTGTYQREVVLPKNAASAFLALEPEIIDSYVTINIIPLKVGEEYPIFRIPRT